MSHRVPSWQPLAESVAVVVLLASGLCALFLALPNPGVFDPTMLTRAGALSTELVVSEPWRLLACTWLHADWEHLIGNIVMMLLMSVLLTRALGWDRYLLLYLAAGLSGSVVSAVLEQPALNVGASGAVFGLTGATVAYALNPRSVLHELEVHAVREALLPIVGMQLLFSFLPGISWGAHLGGFGMGFALAFSGLLDLGLPERVSGSRMPPVRWSWVLSMTVVVLAAGCCSSNLATLALLLLYVFVLVLSGQSGPDWRPDLYPGVMLAALAALGVNGAAVGTALVVGQPWALQGTPAVDDLPDGVEVALPGGLGEVWLPAGLAESAVEEAQDGAAVTQFGTRERYPFALRVVVRDAELPAAAVARMRSTAGPALEFVAGDGTRPCPWLGWSTPDDVGTLVFTGQAVVELQLLRWERPADPAWAAAEDQVASALYRLEGCAPAAFGPGELGLGMAAAGLDEQALRLLDRQLQDTPEDHGLRLARAELALTAGTCQGALIDFDRLVRAVPQEARAWTGLARSTLECGPSREDLLTAEEAGERAVRADPRSAPAWEVLGDVRVALGMRESAEQAMRQAAGLVPEGPERDRLLDRADKARRGFRVRDRIGD